VDEKESLREIRRVLNHADINIKKAMARVGEIAELKAAYQDIAGVEVQIGQRLAELSEPN